MPQQLLHKSVVLLRHFIVAHVFRFFSEGSSVLMRFLCVTAFFPVFSPGVVPVSFSTTRCIPPTFDTQVASYKLSTGRPLCPKIPLAITSPINLSSSSSVIFQFILKQTRWALAAVHFIIFLSIASSNKTRNDDSGLTVFSDSACCKCSWARFEAQYVLLLQAPSLRMGNSQSLPSCSVFSDQVLIHLHLIL